jgi:hypothetical protein
VRGMEGPLEVLIAGVIGGFLAGGWACGPLGPLGSTEEAPMDDANHECEVAWVAANDGDPETEPGGIVGEPWCVQHNAAKRVDQARDDAPEVAP